MVGALRWLNRQVRRRARRGSELDARAAFWRFGAPAQFVRQYTAGIGQEPTL